MCFKVRLIAMIFLICSSSISAQSVEVKGGPSFSTMAINNNYLEFDPKVKLGFHIGSDVDIALSNTFSLVPGLLFTTKGLRFKEEATSGGESYSYNDKLALYYLDLIFNVKGSVAVGKSEVYGKFGPIVGVGLLGRSKGKETLEEDGHTDVTEIESDISWGTGVNDDLKRLDYGLSFGAGILVKSIFLEVSFDLGLANLEPPSTIDDSAIRNRNLRVSLGYKFGKKKN